MAVAVRGPEGKQTSIPPPGLGRLASLPALKPVFQQVAQSECKNSQIPWVCGIPITSAGARRSVVAFLSTLVSLHQPVFLPLACLESSTFSAGSILEVAHSGLFESPFCQCGEGAMAALLDH